MTIKTQVLFIRSEKLCGHLQERLTIPTGNKMQVKVSNETAKHD